MTELYGYPEHRSADVLAADGGVVHLRPVRPADAAALQRFHEQLSDRTRYLRWFGPHPTLSMAELDRATNVDHRDRVALLAILGGEIVAMGIYERLPSVATPGGTAAGSPGGTAAGSPGGTAAEVAFVVDDEHQRRGLGSVLLEHLAAVAAENGIDTFVAEVLAENRAMVTVFRDAGYQVRRSYDGSVVHVEFAIDRSDALRAVRDARERASEARSVGNLLAPRSVAVIGASANPAKVGGTVYANLLAEPFAGPVFPVNSAHRSVRGVRAYAGVRDIPDDVDLAVIAVPAGAVDEVLDDCLAKGVKGLVVVSAGYAEAGASGANAERELVASARRHGMRVVGPNALGVANTDPAVALNATLASVLPARGRIGFFCQSGPLGAAILAEAAERNLGLSTFVSAGNRADVSGNDMLQFWDVDPATDVVLLYLESFGNPRKFSRIARRLARSKPIVVLGSERSVARETGARDLDHTVFADLFAQAGVVQVNTIGEMFDVAALLACQPLPHGDRVRVISNSAALSLLAVDAAAVAGLEVPTPEQLPPEAEPDAYRRAVAAAARERNSDAVLVIYVPPVPTDTAEYAAALLAAAGGAGKPVVTSFTGLSGLPAQLAVPDEVAGVAAGRGSLPSFRDPEQAVRALARAVAYARWRDGPAPATTRPDGLDPAHARRLIGEWIAAPARWLGDDEAVELLGCYGVQVVAFRPAHDAEDAVRAAAELGYPVAVKATGETWRVRADLSGVRLNLTGPDAVRDGYRELAELTGDTVVHVQRMTRGIGCVLRVRDDRAFGSVISFGLSGLISDLLGDRAYRALPLTDAEAAALIDAPRAAPLLSGYRGSEVVDKAALIELVQRVSTLCDDVPEVRGLALEPVLAATDGVGVLYARIRIGPVPSRFDDGPRRLH